ncbi:ATP-binding protein [Asticcacaulis excentricus]|uniref:Adenylate kinase-like protein n=1 Tax=Asticcacaulis excentricus (strain ATCC 15261 / DSM 4724 / KCTC 12464 / NCIMB 9791 / VKM B-1370 / CB 48) TaxID=573065 RepID=E8RPY0_ASTEC|nr:adenylate kinase-like protein [Asticcacaulis excentricus CB 48]
MNNPCILVFGISGVGKSTACKVFTNTHPEFKYVSASEIISSATSHSPEKLRKSSEAEIEKNQTALISALNDLFIQSPQSPIILDAHAVIDNDEDLIEIPTATIQAIRPLGLILLEAPPLDVIRRRQIGPRRRPLRDVARIELETAKERKIVQHYAEALDIPLEIDEVLDGYELESAIDRLTRGTTFNALL